jgi:membrane-associated phospholipid phosphatase
MQRHFGWKVGLPAYAAASYVAASRVEMKKHYLSDVTFGALLGITAGRTVSIGSGRKLFVSPIASEMGPGVGVTLIGSK